MKQPEKISVLCIDDEEAPLFLRKKVLEKSGYEVHAVTSAREAVSFMRDHRVDVVITDQLMPDMLGTELAIAMKKMVPEVVVVLLSGVNDVPSGAEHADLFVSKLEGPSVLSEQLKMLTDTMKQPEQRE